MVEASGPKFCLAQTPRFSDYKEADLPLPLSSKPIQNGQCQAGSSDNKPHRHLVANIRFDFTTNNRSLSKQHVEEAQRLRLGCRKHNRSHRKTARTKHQRLPQPSWLGEIPLQPPPNSHIALLLDQHLTRSSTIAGTVHLIS